MQELPPEIAERVTRPPRGEAGLRGHLSSDEGADAEQSGSLAYVPPDPKDDTQLNYAVELLRGLQVNVAFPPDPNRGIPN
jgi:carboxyl-terminal processing protease